MREKKLQVFVSSTFIDLKEERQAAVEAILSSGHIPAGMELFTAGDETQMTVIKKWIDQSDVYLLILGGRYGSIEPKSGKSYTQLEYEYAAEKGKALFAVVIADSALDDKVKTQGRGAIEQEHPQKLKDFREIVLNKLVKFWKDLKDIKISIYETLSDFNDRKDLIGWIRGDNAINTGVVAEEIAKLTKENSELRSQLSINNNNANYLYGGLTYAELENLLKEEDVKMNGDQFNLFELLLNLGPTLASGYHSDPSGHFRNREMIQKLMKYKLIQRIDGNAFALTENGHNFYIKALALLSIRKIDNN